MSDARVEELIQKYVDRLLTPAEGEELSRRLEEDPEAAAAFAEATRQASFLETSLGELAREGAPPRRRTRRRRPRGFPSRAGSPVALLAAASVLFGLFLVLLVASLSVAPAPVVRREPAPAPVVPRPVPPSRNVPAAEPDPRPVEPPRPGKPSPAPVPRPEPEPPKPPAEAPRKPDPAPAPSPDAPVPPRKPVKPPEPEVTAVAVATLREAEGDVRVSGAPARAGMTLRQDSRVECGRDSRAMVAFEDGTRMDLEPESVVVLPSQAEGKRVRLRSGRLRSKIARQPAGRAMVFTTPQAEATVVGTALRLGVEDGGITRLEVTEGTVRFGRAGERRQIAVSAGHYALASGSVPIRSLPFAEETGTVDHAGVRGVAFTRDGARVAAAGADGSVKIWDAATGSEAGAIRQHPRDARSVDLSSKGGLIVVGSFDDTASVTDLRTGRLVRRLSGASSFHVVRFSPTNRFVASATADGVVRLWEVATGTVADLLQKHEGTADALAFSPDGRMVVSGGSDGAVRVWDVPARRERAVLRDHGAPVAAVAYSPDGRTLASAGADGTVRLRDASTGEVRRTLRTSGPLSLAYGPDGRHLASSGADGSVILWDTEIGCVSQRLAAAGSRAVCVAWSPDGRRVASGREDGRITIWRVR